MRTKKDIQMLLESGLSSAFVAKLNDCEAESAETQTWIEFTM